MEAFLFSILIWASSLSPNLANQNSNYKKNYLAQSNVYYSQNIIIDKTCLECHSDLMSLKRKHKPATEGCDKCHTPNGKEHPLENVKGFSFVKEVPALCYTCHEDIKTKKNIHKPARDGKCVDCHSPHSSKNKKLLTTKKSRDLCKECHDLKIPETNIIHNPVKGGRCHKCHDPHQSRSFCASTSLFKLNLSS